MWSVAAQISEKIAANTSVWSRLKPEDYDDDDDDDDDDGERARIKAV